MKDKKCYVYFDHVSNIEASPEPKIIGALHSSYVRNSEIFSFEFAPSWLDSKECFSLDPHLKLWKGRQYSSDSKNFRVFLDSCPDRWGRILMQRREALNARIQKRSPCHLFEIDYLLGVHDAQRLGALRFKTTLDGPFIDDKDQFSAPPISSLRELEHAVSVIEEGHDLESDEYIKWLSLLISPGSSLGGARPKASIKADDGSLWLAKFPSRFDDYDVGAWEYVVYLLALKAGIVMSPCRVIKLQSRYHTFLTKRFDRTGDKRVHFSSAMTQLGYYDGESGASYIELAEYITTSGVDSRSDLEQLWRRIIFYIAVSNTDDHLRNHGFMIKNKGWVLSPAYDINPTIKGTGLSLNISELDNRLDFDLALEVRELFQLSDAKANEIIFQVKDAVSAWIDIARSNGIDGAEILRMESAFRHK